MQAKRLVKMFSNCLRRFLFKSSRPSANSYLLACSVFLCSSLILAASASDSTKPQNSINRDASMLQSNKDSLFNHKMEPEHGEEAEQAKSGGSRQSRQYDGPLSASGTGSYASVAGDSAYVAQSPVGVSGYASASGPAGAYAADLGANYNQAAYHDPLSIARGIPGGLPQLGSAYPSMAGPMGPSMFAGGPMGGGSGGGGGGLLASSMFPLMAKGFDVSEIVCTAIAVAIGAVIVGAPFILLYLFVMNQMNGNGPSAMGPSGGAISLTGPTSSTTVSGRKKRHTSFPEALLKQLGPLVNSEQVAQTFKVLMNSIAKYQM